MPLKRNLYFDFKLGEIFMLGIPLLENCTWERLSPAFTGCPTPRAAFGMCAVGSKIVIFGGRDSTGRKNDLFVLNTGKSADSTRMKSTPFCK